jgi:hypothetical protein
MNNAGEALMGLVAAAIILLVYFVGTSEPVRSAICPHPVYQVQSGTNHLLACNGHVTLLTPTPARSR